jgi:hypothetical protein
MPGTKSLLGLSEKVSGNSSGRIPGKDARSHKKRFNFLKYFSPVLHNKRQGHFLTLPFLLDYFKDNLASLFSPQIASGRVLGLENIY